MASRILLPSSLPSVVAGGHGFKDDSAFAGVARGAGYPRARRRTTAEVRTYSVSWVLSTPQMSVLHSFFEEVLLAGERHFIARVKNEQGLRYWEAAWVEPYSAQPFATVHGVHWNVAGQIVMFGEPMATAPTTGLLTAEYGLELEGTAEVVGASRLVAEYGLALEIALPVEAEYGLELESYEPFYLAIGDGFRMLIGDGHRMKIE